MIDAVSLVGNERYDYADAFAIEARRLDTRSAEDLVRFALEQSPRALVSTILFVHRHFLRFRQGPASSPDHILGWKIVRREPDVVILEAVSPLLRGLIVARKVEPARVVVTTYVSYARPLGGIVMKIVAPLHRRVAPYLLERGVTGTDSASRRNGDAGLIRKR